MTNRDDEALCKEVEERLGEVLDRTASSRLLEHVADCDRCRDTRHLAEEARQLAAAAGLDHQPPSDLEARVLALIDEQGAGAAGRPAQEVVTPAQAPKRAGTPPLVAVLVSGLAIAAAFAFVVARGGSTTTASRGAAWSAKVERLVSARGVGRLVACDAAGARCNAVAEGTKLERGARVKTDADTRAELQLSDGSRVTLDRSTELALVADGGRRARLVGGAVVADIAHTGSEAEFELPSGAVTVHGTKFSLRAEGKTASVDVSRGSVTLSNGLRGSVRVSEGETGRIDPGGAPSVAFSSSLGDALGWSDEVFDTGDRKMLATRGLGSLTTRKPGQDVERSGAVRLASHAVHVRIAGLMARTEIEEVFENQSDEVLEGIYRFPLPPDAQIERLALDVDGKLEEGAFVDRDRAAAIFRGALVNAAPKQPKPLEEIVWVPGPWRDPALLEWQRGGRFELRIFPIPRHGSRRVVLAYTEVVKPSAGARRYTYPLAYDPSGSTRVGHFAVDVELRGNDRDYGVQPLGYTFTRRPSGGDATALALAADDFVPAGDMSVEYALPGRERELTAWTYLDARGGGTAPNVPNAPFASEPASDGAPYVALALRPKLPRPERETARAVAIVVDSSRSMLGENYARASALAVRLASELDESDRVTVLACGVDCALLRGTGGEGLVPGAETAAKVRRFLGEITPEDASDLVGGVDRALRELESNGGRSRRVIYVGDGAPTAGQVRPGSIERAVRRSVLRVPASVVTVGIGSEADTATLDAVARGGDGVLLPYAPGRSTAEMAYGVLAASSGSGLGDVSVTLPEGLRAAAPSRLSSIPAGGEAFVLARMDNLEAKGDVVLRGRVGGKAFEQRYPLTLAASSNPGNAFVPRLYAAAHLADLERDGSDAAKREAIKLSTDFRVASRYTSLLVLESPAMFHAFGLDPGQASATFTGDEEAESSDAEGTEEIAGEADTSATGSASADKGRAEALGGLSSSSSAEHRLRQASGGPQKKSEALDAFAGPPSAARPAPAPAPKPAAPAGAFDEEFSAPPRRSDVLEPTPFNRDNPSFDEPRRRYIPMRRIWERQGEVLLDRFVPNAASGSAIAAAERAFGDNPNRRDSAKKLFTLLLQGDELERAAGLAARWAEKEPLDPEALTARADVLAARGERASAIRVLGSVLDARPGDVASAKRLARLERWSNHAALGCRFSIAIAEQRPADAALLADAVRCARETFDGATAEELLESASGATREAALAKLSATRPDERALRGELKLEATWHGGADLDLAVVDPDGHRVSWLGAPTRGIITAQDVTSSTHEGLALSGTKPGDYAVEIVQSGTVAPSDGELTISVAGTTRRIPFVLDGTRRRFGIARITMRSRLVPL